MPSDTGEDFRWFWEKLEQHLKRLHLKQTKQRKIIVSAFLEAHSHVDAEDLHKSIRAQGHKIGLATIYRTLNLLREANLVIQNTFDEGRSLYEIFYPGQHHDHLICLQCKRIWEFNNEEIEEIQLQVAADHGFSLTAHRLDLYGKCQDCRASAP